MTLKEHPAMVLVAEEEGRRAALDVLQATMLRFLTAMPPGKVRFTILDPVGLGESFGSFMHLADYDEQLISSRIWTEPRQIEEQLTRLTEHMETVLQKYLRNEFATIDEYNERAGEVAEPFHVLVVANFPANFNDTAAETAEHRSERQYLRNEFATIDEYNEQAGEVAEPFHVLVVANFPANFNDTAARKLLSIVQSGRAAASTR